MKEKKFCKFCGAEIDKELIVCPKCGRQLKLIKAEHEEEKVEANIEEKSKFYSQDWFMWLMLFLFPPVGIFLMWKFNEKLSKNIKVILSVVFGFVFLIAMFSGEDETTNDSDVPSDNNSNEVITKKVEMINFGLMTEHEILTWCYENNLNCSIKREYSDLIAKDKYIKQSVNANEQVAENTKITITFSLGKEPTVSQQNAVKKAKSYLNFMSFSRKGLIEQLEYEGFSNEDAIYGVDHVEVDWNEQAVKKAKSYLSFSAFSRKGLIEQLEYEGFTHEQAVYGVEQNGL